MMSAAAPVGAGGFIAACQSIGATGTLSFATAAIANGLFGVAAGSTAYAAYCKFLRKEEPLTEEEIKLLVNSFRNVVMI